MDDVPEKSPKELKSRLANLLAMAGIGRTIVGDQTDDALQTRMREFRADRQQVSAVGQVERSEP